MIVRKIGGWLVNAVFIVMVLAYIVWCHEGTGATPLVIPNTFSNGQVIDALMMNANFNAVALIVNGDIDNSNIGGAGIYASQIICSTASNCTLGGNQLLSVPYGLNIATTMPLQFNNVTTMYNDATNTYINAQTSAGGVVIQNVANTASNLIVSDGGGVNIPRGGLGIAAGGETITLGGLVVAEGGVDLTTGNLSLAAGNLDLAAGNIDTTGFDFTMNGPLKVMEAVNQTPASYVPPVYTASAGPVGSTYHHSVGTLATMLSGSCAAGAVCNLTGSTVSLTNNAVFSTTTYICWTSAEAIPEATAIYNRTPTSFQIAVTNVNSGSIGPGAISIDFDCQGT
jgi:hypothetical protein